MSSHDDFKPEIADFGEVARRKRNNAKALDTRSELVSLLRVGSIPTKAANAGSRTDTESGGRAGLYMRVSTAEQARMGGEEEGYSIPYQRDAVRRKAQDLKLSIHDEYIDAGFSGRDLKRPAFQRLIADVLAGKVTHVIVHKLDRLGRSKQADYAIDQAVDSVGALLVSVAEHVDGTPAGKMNLQLYRGMAHYYSDNLGNEVLKGLTVKHAKGGTPGRAPLGYLNKRRIEDYSDIRWVEADPERAPHIQWAFSEYASGNWSLANLADALEDRGLRTRRTPRVPSRPVSIGSLHKILSNPYYAGVVSYRGAYREGKHEALVPLALWIQVQDVLSAHNTAGERDNRHAHYLRGSIWCSTCGERMVFSRNKGRGGVYDYYFCMGRKDKERPCPRGFVRLPAIENAIEHFYDHMQLTGTQAERIRAAVFAELSDQRAQAERDVIIARRQIAKAEHEQEKTLAAHIEGAVPLELLKKQMRRISADLEAGRQLLADTQVKLGDITRLINNALELTQQCHRLYAGAKPTERRMINQGFFTRLYIDEDGSVSDAELQEPFVHLLAADKATSIQQRLARLTRPLRDNVESTSRAVEPIPRGEQYRTTQREPSTTATRLRFGPRPTYQPVLVYAAGLNNELLAEVEGFEPPVRVN